MTGTTGPRVVLMCLLGLCCGCGRSGRKVVVYTALDRNFSEPIFKQFEAETGIRVLPKYDTESTKTVGLVHAIIAEAAHPRCDVFWNNEIVNTVRLKDRGLLQACRPPNAALYPEGARDPDNTWFGFAARARVIIVNTDLVNAQDMPAGIRDLAAPRFRGRTGIAKPLFGTTASHVACLFALLGPERAKELLLSLKIGGISVESGNKSCAVAVASGRLAAGLTDTDDAMIEIRRGAPVKMVFPDARPGEMGTLLIPNTVALIKNAPHPREGRELIDYLLSPEVEERLARSASAQIPMHRGYGGTHPLGELPENRMEADFNEAATVFEHAAAWVRKVFLAPD